MSRVSGVSVAVLSWNGRRHLEDCLPALAAQDDPGIPWEVLLLDNGSRDDTAAWVREHHPWVRLVESRVNLGFCAGNNRLVREAAYDAVAFLNNDTRPEPGWLAALTEALAEAPDDVAAVSGQIVDWEGERLDFGRGVMTFDGHGFQLDFRRPLAQAEIPQAGEELFFACGGNMLIRRRSFLDAGGFDEDYFAYLEDVDLGWRLWSGGERVVFTPDARVRHRSSATSDLLGLHNRGFLFERNAFLTVFKNYEEDLWRRMMPAVLLTFNSRTQCLLVYANAGGETFIVDPYAGHIADTARTDTGKSGAPVSPAPAPAPEPGAGARLRHVSADLLAKWRRFGTGEMLRRGVRKLGRRLSGADGATPASPVTVADERTVAQLRAQNYLLGHLEAAAEKRRAVQARRRRSDREIFERFPLYLVPTYPGDEDLFADPGFAVWLPDDVPLIRRRLDEVMCFGEE